MESEKKNGGIHSKNAIITNIQGFSIHDGPGIRTVVFFKGCPLSCRWCANPECLSETPRVGFIESLCTRCGTCLEVCPNGAIRDTEGEHRIDYSRCDSCDCDLTYGCDADCDHCDPECECECDLTYACDAGCEYCDPECKEDEGCFSASLLPNGSGGETGLAPLAVSGILIGVLRRRRRARGGR